MVGEVSRAPDTTSTAKSPRSPRSSTASPIAIGMDVDDPDETLYAGLIPGSPWKAPTSASGTLELQLIAHQGVSATFSDGMTSGASAAVAAAEAVIRGADPDPATRRAVREITRDRRIWNIERNKLAVPFDYLLRAAPEVGRAIPLLPPRQHHLGQRGLTASATPLTVDRHHQ